VPLARQRWVWARVWPMRLQDHHLRLRPAVMAHQCPEACTRRPGQMIRVVLAVPVAPAVLGNTARAGPVDLLVDPAAQAGPVAPDLAVLVARADLDTQAAPVPTVRADRVVPVAQADLAVLAVLGTGMPSVATSTEPRGEKDPLLGATASHPGRTGEGHSRRQGVTGMRAQSTTGATKKRPCGIPDSTSGASTSSESGSRCR
jgi:hypothetical protein